MKRRRLKELNSHDNCKLCLHCLFRSILHVVLSITSNTSKKSIRGFAWLLWLVMLWWDCNPWYPFSHAFAWYPDLKLLSGYWFNNCFITFQCTCLKSYHLTYFNLLLFKIASASWISSSFCRIVYSSRAIFWNNRAILSIFNMNTEVPRE